MCRVFCSGTPLHVWLFAVAVPVAHVCVCVLGCGVCLFSSPAGFSRVLGSDLGCSRRMQDGVEYACPSFSWAFLSVLTISMLGLVGCLRCVACSDFSLSPYVRIHRACVRFCLLHPCVCACVGSEHREKITLPRDLETAKEMATVLSVYADTHRSSVMAAFCCTYIL
jgi:hypothetical protein